MGTLLEKLTAVDEERGKLDSRIRNLVIGSTTSATLRSCRVPVLLFW
jgi:nucleotide-binding universal stress UspA family protein